MIKTIQDYEKSIRKFDFVKKKLNEVVSDLEWELGEERSKRVDGKYFLNKLNYIKVFLDD